MIHFQIESPFTGWTEGQTSKFHSFAGLEFDLHKVDPRIRELRQMIARFHTTEAKEPYFYSVKKICPFDERLKTAKKLMIITILACIAISIAVVWKTAPYFQNRWKLCQEIAAKKKFIIENTGIFIGNRFVRYATADDIWYRHPAAGTEGQLLLRNAFCFLLPFAGFLGGSYAIKRIEDEKYKCGINGTIYHLMIERTKDTRICPSNFDIENDIDVVTQEKIPTKILHSPRVIYTGSYVTEARTYVLPLLLKGEEDFHDPFDNRQYTKEERDYILSQIEKIFLISREQFYTCLAKKNTFI